MIKEIKDIIEAYDLAQETDKKCALATVVYVEGSSYRRPGARMLVDELGNLTGAISGGCLEGDALRKALFAIFQQQNSIVSYDSTDEDDIKFGVQLGCNGIVHILFEPVDAQNVNNPVNLLRAVADSGAEGMIVTLFSLQRGIQPGTQVVFVNGEILPLGTVIFNNSSLHQVMYPDIHDYFLSKQSGFKHYKTNDQSLTAFLEFVEPPISLVVAGAGNDVQPLVELAYMLGWSVTVVDGRPSHAIPQRFPKAERVLVRRKGEALADLTKDGNAVFLLMTHNYNYDLSLLKELAESTFGYIGILGPAQKRDRLLADMKAAGVSMNDDQLSKIYGPIGLDIGAETATEIALSVIAEVKAVLSNRSGISLRSKQQPIHDRIIYHTEKL